MDYLKEELKKNLRISKSKLLEAVLLVAGGKMIAMQVDLVDLIQVA